VQVPARPIVASLEHVTLRYGDREILHDLQLPIVGRAITCLIGLSGAGKSTILRLINGLRRPTSGNVYVDGRDIGLLNARELIELRRSIGFAFQFSALFDSLTIYDNIALPLREIRPRLSMAEINERVEQSLHLVGLDGVAQRLPSELSGGMVKRAGFARAVITHPHIVLYDEPTTGLDPILTHLLTETIRELQRRDQSTVVVVSHDLSSIYTMADYLAMLGDGGIIAYGTLEQIRASTDPRVQQFLAGRTEGPIKV